jgi:hypothetical protein
MSVSGTMEPWGPAADPARTGAAAGWWNRLELQLERLGDRLNPILVKEARQALKSRQFLVTFSLLLFCGVAWSFVAVSFTRDGARVPRVGAAAFAGYYVVLTVPLLVIIPYAAFQSLAAERHEGTFDLLSITTLSSRQIVLGKLSSALLQMLVYYSALAPCIAFTYLLPGIDIITIVMLLVEVFAISIFLCSLSLLLAALTRESSLQVVTSASLVIILVLITWAWLAFSVDMYLMTDRLVVGTSDFWIANLLGFTVGASFLVLFLEAAAARLRFAAANRSTTLRWIMLGQQLLFVGWMAAALSQAPPGDSIWRAFFTLMGGYWALMGFLLTSELGELSPRAQRELPQTALGVVMLTWFNPGSGTGYMFALVNMFLIVELGWIHSVVVPFSTNFSTAERETLLYGCAIWCYLAVFLGLGRLFIMALRRFLIVNFAAAVLLQVLPALAAAAAPYMVVVVMDWDDGLYRWFQATNWFWTLAELQNSTTLWNNELAWALGIVGGLAALVLGVNVRWLADDVARFRAPLPRRLQEELAEPSPFAEESP